MVIKNINRPDKNFRLLIEEQRVENKRYRISDSYAPNLENIGKRITISEIDENSFDEYKKIKGLDLRDGKIQSFWLIDDKNRSTHAGEFLEDELGYYEEIIDGFKDLINSGKSEFTGDAIKVLSEFYSYKKEIGSAKNGI